MKKIMARCPECNTTIGHFHSDGCDCERCPICGEQALSCSHTRKEMITAGRLTWTGHFPMTAEAVEYGFYCKRTNNHIHSPWVPCDKEDPHATPDLNRVSEKCIWDPKLRKYVLRKGS